MWPTGIVQKPARLNGTAAEQHTIAVGNDAAHNNLQILVRDKVAIGANQPFAVIPFEKTSNQSGHGSRLQRKLG
jgi:hypothetical protein